MTSRFLDSGVDLDNTYVGAADPNFSNLNALNISQRKVVMFGQNVLTNVYPLGNLGNAFNTANYVNISKIDKDINFDVLKTLPTAILYQNRNNTSQIFIRGQFNLLENTPQTDIVLNNTTNRLSPVQVGTDTDWSQLSVNGSVSKFSIKSNGTLWAWGANGAGQLGLSDSAPKSSPIQVGNSLWKQVCCSDIGSSLFSTLAIQSNGTLWAWGWNNNGQLGLSNTTNYSSPVQVGSNYWKFIYAGASSYGIQSDGTLWAWGSNGNGQLGTSDLTTRFSPVQIGTSLWKKATLNDASSQNSFIGIQTNGTLWACGYGSSGRLGNNSTSSFQSHVQVGTDLWKDVAQGFAHGIGIKTDGTLWAWGTNNAGQLGNNSTNVRVSPIQVGTALWTQVEADYQISYGIQSDGTLWAWGNGGGGQLGTSDVTDRYTPVQIGTNYWKEVRSGAYAIRTDGTLWTWGANTFGSLGLFNAFLTVTKTIYGI